MKQKVLKQAIIYFLMLCLMMFSAAAIASAAESKAPSLVITQIVPDTDNIDGSNGKAIDGYELIEIYNNSGKDINLDGYSMIYAYSDDLSDAKNQVWPLSKTIKAGAFMYVWVKQSTNELKVADYVKYWGNIKESQVITADSNGMANGSRRVIAIVDSKKNEISRAVYNDKQAEAAAKKSFVYGVSAKGGIAELTLGVKQDIELGKLRKDQVPAAAAAAPAKSAPAKADSKASKAEAGKADSKASSAKTTAPTAMPKTGMGGTQDTEGANVFLWTLGALAAAAALSVAIARRKSSN
jgi:hypothetical protein